MGGKKSVPWLLLDYDDTLGGILLNNQVEPNFKAFLAAENEYCNLMVGLGFQPGEAILVLRNFDETACNTYGFGDMDRYARSMIQAYAYLEACRGYKPEPSIIFMLNALGTQIHDQVYTLLPNANEVLLALSDRYRLAIVTKGSFEVQSFKLKTTGVERIVDEVFVVQHKSYSEWHKIVSLDLNISEDEFSYTWVVGNSIKSDINPPRRIGLNAIHLRTSEWDYEKEAYAHGPGKLHKVDHLVEAKDILLKESEVLKW